ncbi:MAG TPA: hypothetical protein VGG29_11260 [Caulobacteraceae bacterium]
MPAEREVSIDQEVATFRSAADQVALGDLSIRRDFARNVMILFGVANVFVLFALTGAFVMDCIQLWAGKIGPTQRVVSGQVVMALLGATTVQLGTVVYTITRAIFPSGSATAPSSSIRG